jgi:hypothetical protein
MAKMSVSGKVVGFVLTIDPANERGKREEIRFTDLLELNKKATQAIEGVPVGPNPRVTISTIYQPYDGAEEVQEGYGSLMVTIGAFATKTFCANEDCDKPVGWSTSCSDYSRVRRSKLCPDCDRLDREADDFIDAHYDRLAREEEF